MIPIFASKVNITTRQVVSSWGFLGTVPNNVLTAANRCTNDINPSWNEPDGMILKKYYGSDWSSLLTPKNPPSTYEGGNPSSDIFDLIGDSTDEPTYLEHSPEPKKNKVDSPRKVITYFMMAIYPEDTIMDVRYKISTVSRIAFYRQHLFYYVHGEGPMVPYRITVDDSPIVIDWNNMDKGSSIMAGLAIDHNLEEAKKSLKIYALDTFDKSKMTDMYFIDLYDVLPPLSTSSMLSPILKDSYQFDLLYYGSIIKYWPHLTASVCKTALTNPHSIRDKYPLLDPVPEILEEKFELERKISDNSSKWTPESSMEEPINNQSITSATITSSPESVRIVASIRNIFDWIPATRELHTIIGTFEMDVSDVVDVDNSRMGSMQVIAIKKHAHSFSKKINTLAEAFCDKVTNKYIPGNDHISAIITPNPNTEHVTQSFYISINRNGSYSVSSNWSPEDRANFAHITDQISRATKQIIDSINDMGNVAFPTGGRLSHVSNRSRIGSISISTYWTHPITGEEFKEFKDRFRSYEKAGIIIIKGLQQSGAYTFNFLKGILEKNPPRTEDLNQYSRLSDDYAMMKWSTQYQGRVVRIYHRCTDLRIEILDADSTEEFELIRRYIFSFLDSLISGPDKLRAPKANQDKISTLSRLQELDPNLFNVRKYDPKASSYCTLCQSSRQPNIYEESDLKELSESKIKKLIPYKNYTLGNTSYYECSSPIYPYLSFRRGHPKGYCLPCCKKTKPLVGSRIHNYNKQCLSVNDGDDDVEKLPEPNEEKITSIEDDVIESISLHILSYGKYLEAGRISRLPGEICNGLFLNVAHRPHDVYLVGVEQSSPSVPECGLAYSLAYIVGIYRDFVPDDVKLILKSVSKGNFSHQEDMSDYLTILEEVADLARAMGHTHYALGGGAGVAFPSSEDLADCILASFVRRDELFTQFSPGGISSKTWPSILIELIRHLYNIEIIILRDPGNGTNITVEIPLETSYAIESSNSGLRIGIIMCGPSGTHPAALLNHNLYLRTPMELRWMVTRRTFSFERSSSEGIMNDDVYNRIRSLVMHNKSEEQNKAIDLQFMTKFLSSKPLYLDVLRLINMKNLCYGITFRSGNDHVYVPIILSPYPIDGTDSLFDVRPDVSLPHKALMNCIESINEYILENNEPYSIIERHRDLIRNISGSPKTIGFITTKYPLYFYHDPIPINPSIDLSAPSIQFPYDSRSVDISIKRSSISPTEDESTTRKARKATIKNNLYKLFLAEFSSVLSRDRNEDMRRSISKVINGTNFSSSDSVRTMRMSLSKLLSSHPRDNSIVKTIINKYISDRESSPNANIINSIGSTTLELDRKTMHALRSAPSHSDTRSMITKIMETRVLLDNDANDQGMDFTDDHSGNHNMYTSCDSKGNAEFMRHCKKTKLSISESKFVDFCDILAADIRNPSKEFILSSVSSGVLDPLDFIRRPGEFLSIKSR